MGFRTNVKQWMMKFIDKEMDLYRREQIILIDGEVKDIKAEKKRNDEEFMLYRAKKMQELNTEIIEHKINKFNGMMKIEIKCAEDTAKFEHDYHSGIEEKKSELAGLDGEIASKEWYLEKLNKVLKKVAI